MKRFLAVAICCLLLFTPGCSAKVEQNADVLNIEMVDAGYGTAWAYEMAEKYMATHEGKTINIKASATMSLSVENKLTSGPSKNNVGLFITEYEGYRNVVDKGASAVKGYDYAIADLSDIYTSVVDGVQVRDKLQNDELLNYVTYKGKQWVMPWAGGPCGIVYNKTLFDHYGWKEPATVSALLQLCDDILTQTGGKVYPFAYPGSNASIYWSYIYNTWHAQYEGKQNYSDFWNCLTPNSVSGQKDNIEGYKVFAQEGRRESMLAFESLFTDESGNPTGYMDPDSSTYTHTDAQSQMLFGNVAMVPTGDWIENEMKKSGIEFKTVIDGVEVPTEIAYMPTPLLDVVDSWKQFEGQSGDYELESGEVIAKSELYQRYTDAKNMCYTLMPSMQMVVPSYVASKDLAKDFIKFMISDEGCEIFLKNAGSLMPYKQKNYSDADLDALGLSEYQKRQVKLSQNAIFVAKDITSPIRYKYGLGDYNQNQPYDKITSRAMKAEDLFNAEVTFTRTMWNSILIGSGIIRN